MLAIVLVLLALESKLLHPIVAAHALATSTAMEELLIQTLVLANVLTHVLLLKFEMILIALAVVQLTTAMSEELSLILQHVTVHVLQLLAQSLIKFEIRLVTAYVTFNVLLPRFEALILMFVDVFALLRLVIPDSLPTLPLVAVIALRPVLIRT